MGLQGANKSAHWDGGKLKTPSSFTVMLVFNVIYF